MDYKDKNVGFIKGYKAGAKKRKPVISEDGSVGGYHIEHYDGSQDAVVTPQTVNVRSRTQEGM